MATFTGTLRKNDLEGGFLELATDGGDVYRLEGAVKAAVGSRVTVHGNVKEAGFGIHMTGSPTLEVDKSEPA